MAINIEHIFRVIDVTFNLTPKLINDILILINYLKKYVHSRIRSTSLVNESIERVIIRPSFFSY